MTETEALGKIMEIIKEDLPEFETQLEIGKIVEEYGRIRFEEGFDDGIAFAEDRAMEAQE